MGDGALSAPPGHDNGPRHIGMPVPDPLIRLQRGHHLHQPAFAPPRKCSSDRYGNIRVPISAAVDPGGALGSAAR